MREWGSNMLTSTGTCSTLFLPPRIRDLNFSKPRGFQGGGTLGKDGNEGLVLRPNPADIGRSC